MTQAGDKPVVAFEDVSFSYGSQPVLDAADFTIHSGQNSYIVGPNGGGKTTLLRLILGLEQPDSGTVRVFGSPPRAARHRVGYVPQYARHDQRFPVSVEEVVLMARLQRNGSGRYTGEDRQAARKAMEQLEVEQLADRAYADLSGGQRQRVLIARALAGEPDLLLMDEPTANIDIRSGRRLFDIIESLAESMTVFMVSHDVGSVHRVFNHIVLVNRSVHASHIDQLDDGIVKKVYGDDHHILHHLGGEENHG